MNNYRLAEYEYLNPSDIKYSQDEVDEIVETLERIIDDMQCEIDRLRNILASMGVKIDD